MGNRSYDNDDLARFAGVLIEDVKDAFKAQFEVLDDIREKVSRIPKIEERLDHIEVDMHVVKTVLREHSREIKDLQAKAHVH